MEITIAPAKSFVRENIILMSLAGFLFFLHLFANAFTSYGYFRDELYYLACSQHLAWGYVDHPPLSVFILALVRTVLGDSLFVIRLVPALALAGTVVFTGLMVRQLRGGTLATLLACLAVMMAPIFLAMGTFYSMNSLDILLWSVAAYQLLRLLENPTPKRWIILGVIMGLGLLNKIGFLWFGAGLLVGLLATPLRKQWYTPWPYVAGGIAFLLFLPFVFWNAQHEWAHLEFMQNAVTYKYSGVSRSDFLMGQLLLPNPGALPLWLGGLYFYFLTATGKPYRILGLIFLTTLTILLINGHSKPEYLAPAYSLLFAGGGVLFEQIIVAKRWRWLFYTMVISLSLVIGLLPMALPLLPVQTYIRYAAIVGFGPANTEGKEMAELPQFYADMFGWESMAENVSKVYLALPGEERRHTRVYAQNYGEAGALEHFSQQYPLPPVISGHNNYWIWGYGDPDIQTVIIIGGEREDHLKTFAQVEQVAVHQAEYAMPYENNLPIFVCRTLKRPIEEAWKDSKKFI